MSDSRFFKLHEAESIIKISRWKIAYHQKYNGAQKPSISLGKERVYTYDDINSLKKFFADLEKKNKEKAEAKKEAKV